MVNKFCKAKFIWWIVIGCGLGAALVVGYLARRQALLRQDVSRVKLIDDFNDGADPNLIGGQPFTLATEGSQISSRYLAASTPGPEGKAYAVEAKLLPQGSVRWGTSLNGLDISAATHLSFWLRADHAISQVTLELVDRRHHTASFSVGRVLASQTRWQRIRLPLQRFPDIDFNRLDQLNIQFHAHKAPLQVTALLDDIAFEGPAELFFHSLRDNLYGFPTNVTVNAEPVSRLPNGAMLRSIAADTWGYFRDLVDTRHHLPLNSVQLLPTRQIGDYASPTDIALYLLSTTSAYDLNLIDRKEALARIRSTLEQLSSLTVWRDFFYNYYNTTNLQVTRPYVSSVDNGWLAAALIVLRRAFPELHGLCSSLLDRMDFAVFYDEQQGQMRLGYDAEQGSFAPYHYGLIATEARILSLVAIGKQDVPEGHWFRIYRTLPREWDWQRQAPKGTYRQYRGHDVFQGYYTYQDVSFVPSWGGSLFEFLMPTLVVKEQELAPQGLGLNNQRIVELHRRYALQERQYPVWGLSPCATPNPHGGYGEFGIADLGSKGYEDHGVVTPYSSILALAVAPEAVMENVRQLIQRYPIYGEYGFYDAVELKQGEVAYRYLALDEGMILLAINNFLNDGILRNRFHADPVGQRIEWLLQAEQFF